MGNVIERARSHVRRGSVRIAAFVVLVAVVASGLTVIEASTPEPVQAAVIGDDYPAYLADAPQDALVDPWNFYNRECTSFVAWRLNNTNGVPFTNQYLGADLWWGNANTWGTSARAKGIRVDNLPEVGSVAWSTAGTYGHVAWVAEVLDGGRIVVEEYNWGVNSKGEKGRYRSRTVAASSWTGFIHVKDLNAWPPSDGSFITVKETGEVYRIAGGAPLYVSNWAPFGGVQKTQTVTAARFATLPSVPKDGTYIRGESSGDVYTIAQGAPIHVQSWAGVGGEKKFVGVDDAAINNAGQPGVWRFLRAQPADGYLRGAVSHRIFRVMGGRPFYVASWAPWGGEKPVVNVDDASLDSCDHLDCTPWGAFDWVTGSPGEVNVSGWAQDPNSLDAVQVDVFVDGAKVGGVSANGSRPDVENVYHRGNNTGFAGTVPAPAGDREVCVTARNIGVGSDTSLGCKTITVPALAAFDAAPTPTIAGTAKVGSTLTASMTAWTPTATMKYQWKANGAVISGASSAAFTLTTAQSGKTITVTTTGSAAGRATTSKTSVATAAVSSLASFATAPVPTITGTARVGSTLTAATTAWTPTATLTYQWKANGATISGATATTFTPTAAQSGKSITVTTTGSAAGRATTSTTSVGTAAVSALATFTTAPVPTISGTATVGSTLTVKTGIWAPAGATLAVSWSRNGVAISGATAKTYTLTSQDLGATITATTRAQLTGYTTTTKTSVATAKVLGQSLTATPVPVITGTAIVGSTLTATAGTWAPAPVQVSYQWLRGGAAISGATKGTYVATAADAGAALSVRATGTKSGFVSVSKTSTATAKVTGNVYTARPAPTISGTHQVGQTLTALNGTWAPVPDAFTYQWMRGTSAIPGATKRTYVVAAEDAKSALSVVTTATRAGYAAVTQQSTAGPVITLLAFTTAPTPTISGQDKVGATLTAASATWQPTPAKAVIQWMRNGAPISGASTAKYKATTADMGAVLTVSVTVTRTGYATVTKVSKGTAKIIK